MLSEFPVTPFMALVLAGYALFMVTLAWVWIATQRK
jgi:hypothetical protein